MRLIQPRTGSLHQPLRIGLVFDNEFREFGRGVADDVQAHGREALLHRGGSQGIDEHGVQIAPLSYPHLSHTEIFDNVETFYKKFYFRAPKIAAIVGEMVRSPQMMKRRLREGVEFFQFLRERHKAAA